MNRSPLKLLLSLIVLTSLTLAGPAPAAEPRPVSVVDYMKAGGDDSSFAARKAIYVQQWPAETYTGTAPQNLKLLEYLLATATRVNIPSPSSDPAKCEAFYSNPEVAKYLTAAFTGNAISACLVTGTNTPQNVIRKELQKAYSTTTPADGKTFTYAEHKAIHDKAYRAAGCQQDSADIHFWMVVNDFKVWQFVVDWGIQTVGRCTVKAEQ